MTVRPPQLDDELGTFRPPLGPDVDAYQERLTGDHSDASGSGEINGCHVDGADLSGSRFERIALTDVRFGRADLSNATWDGFTAHRVEFTGCRLTGFRVLGPFATELLVTDCRWDHGALFLARTRGAVEFRDCSLAGTVLRGDLSKVVFDNCDLTGAEFGLSGAKNLDLRTSRLAGIRGLDTLRGARITPEQTIEMATQLALDAGFRLD